MLRNAYYFLGIVLFLFVGITIFRHYYLKGGSFILPTPVVSPLVSQPVEPTQITKEYTFCTADSQCPTGYKCEASQGTSTTCSSDKPCTPTEIIIKGYCKKTEGMSCETMEDCNAGLICHTYPGLFVQKKCTSPATSIGCSGPTDTKSCPGGYTCVQNCGPIVGRGDEPPPGYSCLINEVAKQGRNCPICLASNTLIDTPEGVTNVKEIKVGMYVWSFNKARTRIKSKVIKIGNSTVPVDHRMVHLVLADGRQLWVSPNHPTILGTPVSRLLTGQIYDGSQIRSTSQASYWDTKTYDLLPDSETGIYFANGIPMESTLKE